MKSKCDNCGWTGADSGMANIKDFFQRVEPGGIVPSGECPDCGALCYPHEPGPDCQIVLRHCQKLKDETRWLQSWLHESPAGKALPEVDRASLGVTLSRLFTLASGGSELRQKLCK